MRYPDSTEIEQVKIWKIGSIENDEGFNAFMSYIEKIADWYHFTHEGRAYHLSTGGWSGNEEVIGAMMENTMFWMIYHFQSRRGGHYIFAPQGYDGGEDENNAYYAALDKINTLVEGHNRWATADGVAQSVEKNIEALKTEMETKNMAAAHALDLIAKLFGFPDWEYPAQVVRDIENEITKFICSSCYEIFDSRTMLGLHQSQKIHDELEDFTKDKE